MKWKIITVWFLFTAQVVVAGEKYMVNISIAPTYERMGFRTRNVKNPFDPKFSYNFGLDYRYFVAPEFSLSVGAYFNDRGFRAHPTYQTSDGKILDQGDAVVVISARYITVPMEFQYNFQPFFRTEIYINAGVCAGYLVNQTFKGKRISNEIQPSESFLKGLSEEPQPINWFDKTYFAWSLGFGISRFVQSRLAITVHPYYYHQFDRLIDPDGPVRTTTTNASGSIVEVRPKFNSYGILFKLGYYFSDQIENTKKTL